MNAKPDRRHTSTVLRELRNRIDDLCMKHCEDYLGDAVRLLYDLAIANPKAVRSRRADIVALIENDDQGRELVEYFCAQEELIQQAIVERQVATALH